MLALILLFFGFADFVRTSLVHIDQGTLNGTISRSRNGNEFYSFYGIPYAQPPVEGLRFQPPKVPPPSWQGTRNATQKPPFCPQIDPRNKGYIGSEDCLYLQINLTDSEALKPVLVFFHGGGFREGSSTLYGPSFFMDQPIVMVTVNSRLGVFGFFSAGESSYPGNYGLKDQTASLQWIQKNIRAFGGNASDVTIMGHSSGSASVHHHTMSPLSKGIFHRVILLSGTANAFFSFSSTERARANFISFQRHANCSRPSTNESVACLLALPVKKLLELASTYKDVELRLFPFNPVIEPFGSEGAFLITNPNRFAYLDSRIPIMFGFTSNERVGMGSNRGMNCSNEKTFDAEFLELLRYKPNPDRESLAQKTIALVKQLYFGNNFANCNLKTTLTLLSDLHFKLAIFDSIKTYSDRAYSYEYDYRDSPETRELGVGHGGDLIVLLPHPDSEALSDEKRKLSETMVTYLSNFIFTGNPNSPNNNKILPTEWSSAKNFTDEYFRIMHISNNGFQMEKQFAREKAELWSYYGKIYWE